jgi:hypothetical protein
MARKQPELAYVPMLLRACGKCGARERAAVERNTEERFLERPVATPSALQVLRIPFGNMVSTINTSPELVPSISTPLNMTLLPSRSIPTPVFSLKL